jgi:hypothetical protein
MANVLAFLSGQSRRDWSQQELAEFYRVERALVQAGLTVVTDRGLSDEGDPWFVFCRAEDGEVVVHFACIDGRYVIGGPAYDRIVSGPDIRSITTELVSQHPLMQRRVLREDNIILHPSALLIAIVATALLKSAEAQAHGELDPDRSRGASADNSATAGGTEYIHNTILETRHVAAMIFAAMFAVGLAPDSGHPVWEGPIGMTPAPPDEANADRPVDAKVGLDLSGSFEQNSWAFDNSTTGDYVELNDSALLTSKETISFLSLVAVLNDIAAPCSQQADMNASAIAEICGVASAPLFKPDSQYTEKVASVVPSALIEIELDFSVAGMPAIDSLKLHGSEGAATTEFQIVAALPSILQPFLSHGVTVDVSGMSAGNVLLALNFHPIAEVSAQTEPDSLTFPAPSNVASATDHPAVIYTANSALTLDHIVQYIERFIDHTPYVNVLSADGDVVFYDVAALKVGEGAPSLDSITWEFADGRSISLVGSRMELPHEIAA